MANCELAVKILAGLQVTFIVILVAVGGTYYMEWCKFNDAFMYFCDKAVKTIENTVKS